MDLAVRPFAVVPAVALSLTLGALASAAGCASGTAPDPATNAPQTAIIDVPTATATPSSSVVAGLRLVSLPTDLPSVALGDERVRGQDYAYSLPRDWEQVHPDAEPRPDSMIAPRDGTLPYYIAVDQVLGVGPRSLDEVVSELADGFSGEGTLGALPGRTVAGYPSAGVIVDASPRTRHVYAISIYAGRAFPIRVTYDPDHEREALAALAAVLDSWTWG